MGNNNLFFYSGINIWMQNGVPYRENDKPHIEYNFTSNASTGEAMSRWGSRWYNKNGQLHRDALDADGALLPALIAFHEKRMILRWYTNGVETGRQQICLQSGHKIKVNTDL